jgi:hypothetical protein
MLMTMFRVALALQAAALLVQSLLAGLILTGDAIALSAHMAVGGASLVIAVVQALAAILLVGLANAAKWLVPANIGFLIAEGLQMAAGRLGLLGIHLPLGVALFGAAVLMSAYAANSLEPTPTQPSGGRQTRRHTAQVVQRGG